jgi:hypothetical protein
MEPNQCNSDQDLKKALEEDEISPVTGYLMNPEGSF